MKKNSLYTLLFCAAALASVAVAEPAPYTEAAVAVAKNSGATMESICAAAAAAVRNDAVSPADVFTNVLSARSSWTAAQVAGLYKSLLMASPELSSSFVKDVQAFEAADKPTTVGADASEGVKLLAALYGAEIPGVNADVVLASIMADTMGAPSAFSVAPLRDVNARAATPVRRPQPVKPTPPAASIEN